MKHVVHVLGARGPGQDRAVFVPRDGGALIVLADGAGGTAHGAEAAQRVVDRLTLDVGALDAELARLGGQSTLVAIEIEGARLRGVSVGDSEAWIVRDDGQVLDLTAHQHRKPLLGDGAIGVPFTAGFAAGTLVVGSDGLFRYAKREQVVAALGAAALEDAAEALLVAARLPGGGLQDDPSLRVREDVGRLRRGPVYRAIAAVLRHTLAEAGFRVVHTSIQPNHLHFLIEAYDKPAFARGMRSLTITAALAINRVCGRKGRVFKYRYSAKAITSPRQARNVLAYVLNNWRRHKEHLRSAVAGRSRLDPYSTAILFDGWKEAPQMTVTADYEPLPAAAPETWLLRVGWRRHGSISAYAVPGTVL